MTTRQDVIAAAREWVGTPFHHHAYRRGVGADCVGVIYGVMRDLGLTDQPLPFYEGKPSGFSLFRHFDEFADVEPRTDGDRPGDIFVFQFTRIPQHAGIFTGPTIIHTHAGVGECVEHTLCSKWQRRHVRTYKIKEVD